MFTLLYNCITMIYDITMKSMLWSHYKYQVKYLERYDIVHCSIYIRPWCNTLMFNYKGNSIQQITDVSTPNTNNPSLHARLIIPETIQHVYGIFFQQTCRRRSSMNKIAPSKKGGGTHHQIDGFKSTTRWMGILTAWLHHSNWVPRVGPVLLLVRLRDCHSNWTSSVIKLIPSP